LRRLAHRASSCGLAELCPRPGFCSGATVACFLGMIVMSPRNQGLGGLLPHLSTIAPQPCPAYVWKPTDGTLQPCLPVFSAGPPSAFCVKDLARFPVHFPQALHSPVPAECGHRIRTAEIRQPRVALVARMPQGPRRAHIAQFLSSSRFIHVDQGLGMLVRQLSTIGPQSCPAPVWTAAMRGRYTFDTGILRGLRAARRAVRVAPDFSSMRAC